jgi:hypothetical protein
MHAAGQPVTSRWLTRVRDFCVNARVKSALSSIVIAMIVIFALPISQLRTVAITIECCCPDPHKCHCPDHKADTSGQPSIRDCHKSAQVFEAPTAPSATIAVIAIATTPARTEISVHHDLTTPHHPPILERPRGPS